MQPMSAWTQATFTVVRLESQSAVMGTCMRSDDGFVIDHEREWDPSAFLGDEDGGRLLEEIERQVRRTWREGVDAEAVAITLPGTLTGDRVIASSSRLGIRKPVDAADVLEQMLEVPVRVFHDLTCMALGEWSTSPPSIAGRDEIPTLAFVFADEGVGSKLLIDGRPYVGAGAAGLLGRLIVEPDGTYYRALAARGPLEVYASRPWLSENLVSLYSSEVGKQGARNPAESTSFRRALEVARRGDWSSLQYRHIADGIKSQDPIAIDVLDDAARYLGFAINALITVAHPHKIVLGGAMFTEIPDFATDMLGYARRYSWALAWNRIEIAISRSDRRSQTIGACELLGSTVGK